MGKTMKAGFIASLASAIVLTAQGALAQVPTLLISTENTPTHVQTRMVRKFVETLAARTQGRLKVEHHDSAELFRDSDIVRALSEGKVQMAVPGLWQLDRYEPNVGIFMLPSFYGLDASTNHAIRDGRLGQEVNARLEEAIDVTVIGRWIDLGHAHLFFTGTDVARHEDLAGLRIRIPGGEANKGRLKAFGAEPVLVPWPDLPLALEQRRVEGMLTTYETIASAELWKKGVRHVFEDQEYFAQYVPIVSRPFWNTLDDGVKADIQASWNAIVDEARAQAADAQKAAKRTLTDNQVTVATPSAAQLRTWRASAIANEPEIVKAVGISEDLRQLAIGEINTRQ